MGSRYKSAREEIEALLQHEPLLTAKELWHGLTCWPIPSVRTIHRFAQGVKRDLAVGPDLAATARNFETRSDSVERPGGFSKEFYMAGEDTKLDQILGHLNTLHEKHDAMKATCDSFGNRLDALEAERLEKAKADAAAASKGKTDAVEDKHAYVDAQMRCDSAYQAWGKQAPHALHGESVRDFRVRLLTELKPHSKVYKDSDLATIGDEKAFSNIEGMIINDAVEASNSPGDTSGMLRKVTSRDEHGRMVTKWYGDSAVTWAPFMGGGTQFGKINSKPNG